MQADAHQHFSFSRSLGFRPRKDTNQSHLGCIPYLHQLHLENSEKTRPEICPIDDSRSH